MAAIADAADSMELTTQEILGTYQNMTADCRNIAAKINELNLDKDEHRLVLDTISKLDSGRRAYRLLGGALVERTVGDITPQIAQNLEGISQILERLDDNLKAKDAERKAFKVRGKG